MTIMAATKILQGSGFQMETREVAGFMSYLRSGDVLDATIMFMSVDMSVGSAEVGPMG